MNDEELRTAITSIISQDGWVDPIEVNVDGEVKAIVSLVADWHTRKLKEAVREEWKLISEVAHSANITAELFISKARKDRLAELKESKVSSSKNSNNSNKGEEK